MMKIREAVPQDAERLDELLTKLIRDEVQYDPNLSGDYVVRDNYAERIGLDGHLLLLAEEEGELAGYLYGFVYQIPGMWKAPVALLDALYVEEKYRRRGCAHMLAAEFRKFAQERGACCMELKVLSRNETALKLYEGLGFVETKKYMALDL